MSNDYYLARQHRLLKEFDKALDRVGGLFVARYGSEATQGMLLEGAT
ncbi:MAG TPA: hypothetical protein PKO09_02290 [Anaerolineae bacterium]|nr:hypothetical protein [Anaerolineae bacterium]